MNLRWYLFQLALLPPESRKKLNRQLRRALRRGFLPSHREWRSAVRAELGFFPPSALYGG